MLENGEIVEKVEIPELTDHAKDIMDFIIWGEKGSYNPRNNAKD